MKVKCIANNGIALKAYKMPVGYFQASQFGVEIGKEYVVMGILMGEETITYLIDDAGIPLNYPYQLFEIADPTIDSGWFFKTYTSESEYFPYRQAICGFYELTDDSYLDRLLELEDEAIKTYFKQKEKLIH